MVFSIGWLLLGFVALGGGITLLLGGTANGIGGLFGEIPALKDFLSSAGGVIGVVIVGVVALVLVTLAALASGFILTRGRVRKPRLVTFRALGWWWMTWSRRGSSSKFSGVTATASATAVMSPRD